MGTIRINATHLERMHHRGTIGDFVIESDEPPSLGGEDAHPKPLDYLTAAIAFCTLTQFARIAPMLDVALDAVECAVETEWSATGSIRLGTNQAQCDGVRLEMTITSPSDRERVAELVARAEAACYAMAALQEPVRVECRTTVNGVPLAGS